MFVITIYKKFKIADKPRKSCTPPFMILIVAKSLSLNMDRLQMNMRMLYMLLVLRFFYIEVFVDDAFFISIILSQTLSVSPSKFVAEINRSFNCSFSLSDNSKS